MQGLIDEATNERFIHAVRTNNLEAVTDLLEQFPEIGSSTELEQGLQIALAAESPLIDTLIDAAGPDMTLKVAARVGDLALVKRLVRAGATPYTIDAALTDAAKFGHLRVFRYLLKKIPSPRDLDEIARLAARRGHGDIVMYLWDRFPGMMDIDDLLVAAVEGSDLLLVEDLINEGATDFQNAADNAALVGNTDMVRYITNNYKVNINRALEAAVNGGNLKTIKMLIRRGGDLMSTLFRVASLEPSQAIPILKYTIRKYKLTPEQVGQIIRVINRKRDPDTRKIAMFMIKNGLAQLSDFHKMEFTPEDIKTLIRSGIDQFGEYTSLVPAALELIRREDITRSHVESHMPTAVSNIVMGFS